MKTLKIMSRVYCKKGTETPTLFGLEVAHEIKVENLNDANGFYPEGI